MDDWLIDLSIHLSITDLRSVHEGDCVIYLQEKALRGNKPLYAVEVAGSMLYGLDLLLACSIPERNAFVINIVVQ